MKKNITYLVVLTLLATFFIACEDSKEDQIEQTFDRSLVLLNWSDNIITPSYEAFQEKLEKLKISVDGFKSNVTQENLDLVRSEWINAYKAWQYVEMFNIGKAEEIYYSSKMNVYAANISSIKFKQKRSSIYFCLNLMRLMLMDNAYLHYPDCLCFLSTSQMRCWIRIS